MVEVRGRQPCITKFEDDLKEIKIERGDDIEIRIDATGKTLSSQTKIYLTTSGLEKVVRNGDLVYFDTSAKLMQNLKCSVIDVADNSFTVRAKENGLIPSESVILVPEKHSQMSVIKDEDLSDLQNLSKLHKIDFISVPFIAHRTDVEEVKMQLKNIDCENIIVLSRIDDRRGLDEFWPICSLSGGIVLNRTNLNYSVSSEKLFALMKFFIEQCNLLGKPLIIDQEVIPSTLKGIPPTRKEAADLQNALVEGVDVVMLDKETSHGPDPIVAIRSVAQILAESE